MFKKSIIIISVVLALVVSLEGVSYAFWLWTPKDKTFVNPKYAVKDSPKEQYQWAMRFYKNSDFKRSGEEFERLAKHYPDSDLAPEAQYYAGRSYEEQGKYYFAFQNYQKTVDNYPYTKRMDEILDREFRIAEIFQAKETSKLMELELSTSLDKAAMIYGKIVENSPFSEYADKSLFKQAECYRRMYQYKEAMGSYERIINDYPASKLVPEAKYQLAYTRYEASLNPEYDQEDTDEAMREFKQIAATTSRPAVSEEANKLLEELKRKKAESVLTIAKFYERQRKDKGALMYYQEIVSKYPSTEAATYAEGRIEILQKRIKD